MLILISLDLPSQSESSVVKAVLMDVVRAVSCNSITAADNGSEQLASALSDYVSA